MSYLIPVQDMSVDGTVSGPTGSAPDIMDHVVLVDAVTDGAYFTLLVPNDWASGVMQYQLLWLPASTDAAAHTVRWSMNVLALPAGTDPTGAGTTTAWTGSSAARTVNQMVYEPAQTLLTPAAVDVLVRADIRRLGGDAADTYVGNVKLVGVIISYTANT